MQSNLKFEELKVWMFILSNLFLIFLKKSEYKIVSEIITEPVLTGCSKIQIGRINQPTYFFAILDRTVSFHIWECVFTSSLEVANIKLSNSKKSLLKFCPDYQLISATRTGEFQVHKINTRVGCKVVNFLSRQILQEGSLLKSSLTLFLTERSGVSVLTPRFCR